MKLNTIGLVNSILLALLFFSDSLEFFQHGSTVFGVLGALVTVSALADAYLFYQAGKTEPKEG